MYEQVAPIEISVKNNNNNKTTTIFAVNKTKQKHNYIHLCLYPYRKFVSLDLYLILTGPISIYKV